MESGHAAGYRQRAPRLASRSWRSPTSLAERRARRAPAAGPSARIYADYTALLAAEAAQSLDFVDIATPPAEHAKVAHAALDAGLARPVRKAAGDDDRKTRARCCATRARAERVIYPCHNYKHAPVIKAVRGDARRRADRPRPPGDAADLPQHARQGRGRLAYRLAARAALLGRRHRDGPRQPHLLPGLRVAARATRRRSRRARRRWGRSTPRTTSRAACASRPGIASAHLSWNAGVRKVLYTVHGEHGAVRVEDDGIEVADAGPRAPRRRHQPGASSARRSAPTGWTRATSAGSTRCSTTSRRAIGRGEFVGREAEEAFLCVQLITTAYASARDGCRELALPGAGAAGRRRRQRPQAQTRRSCSRTSPVRDLHFAWLIMAVLVSGCGGYAFRSRCATVGCATRAPRPTAAACSWASPRWR